MNNYKLFRNEVVTSRLNRSLGTASINLPASYVIVAIGSTTLLLMVFLYLLYAETAEKIYARGYLNSSEGVVKIVSERSGIIKASYVKEGLQLKKDAPLFLINTQGFTERGSEIIDNLNQGLLALKKQLTIKKNQFNNLKTLYEKRFISSADYQEAELRILELKRQVKDAQLNLIKEKEAQSYIIRAPISGIATNQLASKGQYVTNSSPLLDIMPESSNLYAQLYVPAEKIGLIKKGSTVYLKYDAYPSNRFGLYPALIEEINLTVLTDKQEEKPFTVGSPYYKMQASLESAQILAYGKKLNLSQGLSLTAVIIGEKRKIWQWLLDPLFSYYGDFKQ